jgi:hypothetical protein
MNMGISELPEGWFVTSVNLTDEIPYALCCQTNAMGKEQKFLIPKALAYFLEVHWLGSKRLRYLIKKETQDEIKRAMGIEN